MVFFAIALVLLFIMFYYLVRFYNYVFAGDEQLEDRKALLSMMAKVDSLEVQLEANDKLLDGWRNMMAGGVGKSVDTGGVKTPVPAPRPDGADAEFVKAYEKIYGVKPFADANGFTRLYFFSPLKNGRFAGTKGNETEIRSGTASAAVALSSALVISVDTSQGIVVLQHKEGLISKYNNLKGIKVKEQQEVKEAQELSQAANTKIIFSMWYRTRNLKPTEYIAFPK
jgi:hypothetical protein